MAYIASIMGRYPLKPEERKYNISATIAPSAWKIMEKSRKNMPRSQWIERLILGKIKIK
jgi:hypothetical protein